MRTLALIILVLSPILSLAESRRDLAREQRKKEFLNAPVFKVNQDPVKRAENEAAMKPSPSVPSLQNKAAATATPIAPLGTKAVQSPIQPGLARTSSISEQKASQEQSKISAVSSGLPAALPPDSEAKAKGTCGWSAYLKNYCFYQTSPGRWLLCTERWGSCVTRQ